MADLLSGKKRKRLNVGNPDRQGFDWDLPRQTWMPGYTTYLKVAEGCSNTCAFCIIPTLRGPQRSRSIESCVAEAKPVIQKNSSERDSMIVSMVDGEGESGATPPIVQRARQE